jgi:hypothetical protein
VCVAVPLTAVEVDVAIDDEGEYSLSVVQVEEHDEGSREEALVLVEAALLCFCLVLHSPRISKPVESTLSFLVRPPFWKQGFCGETTPMK